MFYFHQHIFYVSSTSHLRYIYEGSTSHLRRIDVSSTKDRRLIDEGSTSHRRGTLKRNESMFHLSPNQVLLAAFSCTKQVDGKPKQLAWACHLLAKSLPSTCEVLANPLPSPCEIPACLFLSFSWFHLTVFTVYVKCKMQMSEVSKWVSE